MDVKTKATRQLAQVRKGKSSHKRKARKADLDTASDERPPLRRKQTSIMVDSEGDEENGAVKAKSHRQVAAAAFSARESYHFVLEIVDGR